MINDPRVKSVKTGSDHAVAGRLVSAVTTSRKAGPPGEMALQSLFGHHATQSMPQGLVRLVGYRDPSRPSSVELPRTNPSR
ncbi:hypothetical protein SAMN05444123_112150 [Rhodopseudomonas pseudopalustris]|uniref:Uncharacterized protein n=1 Tax=Rhodopseudomonas pseudopalustris TaxID=1513892 RepID=A0A1H8WJT2_9BRAD|nr:hypothetical protein SAMN05444123_112150 [Rhodopseudomonas pseudopalustris]